MLSAGLISHFSIKRSEIKQDLSYNFFKLLQDLSFYIHAGPVWLLSYVSSSLWHILTRVTCFGVMLSIGSSFSFTLLRVHTPMYEVPLSKSNRRILSVFQSVYKNNEKKTPLAHLTLSITWMVKWIRI